MYRVYYIGGIKTDGTKATDDRAGENEKESTDSKKEKEDIDSENQTYVPFCCVFIFLNLVSLLTLMLLSDLCALSFGY